MICARGVEFLFSTGGDGRIAARSWLRAARWRPKNASAGVFIVPTRWIQAKWPTVIDCPYDVHDVMGMCPSSPPLRPPTHRHSNRRSKYIYHCVVGSRRYYRSYDFNGRACRRLRPAENALAPVVFASVAVLSFQRSFLKGAMNENQLMVTCAPSTQNGVYYHNSRYMCYVHEMYRRCPPPSTNVYNTAIIINNNTYTCLLLTWKLNAGVFVCVCVCHIERSEQWLVSCTWAVTSMITVHIYSIRAVYWIKIRSQIPIEECKIIFKIIIITELLTWDMV